MTFKWTLQRLLDVTVQREEALRTRLAEQARQIERTGAEINRRRRAFVAAVRELSAMEPAQRLLHLDLFARTMGAMEKAIAKLNETLQQQQSQRNQTMADLVRVRESRKALERLRGEALHRHRREELHREQKEFDRTAQLAFVRKTNMAS